MVDSLDDLHGPVHREVRLPLHLDASAPQVYDLDRACSRRLVYRLVLLETATVQDLAGLLHRDTLAREWPELYLPRVVRAAREGRHPMLRERGAGPHVPSPPSRGPLMKIMRVPSVCSGWSETCTYFC